MVRSILEAARYSKIHIRYKVVTCVKLQLPTLGPRCARCHNIYCQYLYWYTALMYESEDETNAKFTMRH
jgi:hypothetical protein